MADAATAPLVRSVQEVDPRLVRLRRMRWLAGGLLVLMGLVFLIVSFIPSHWGGLGYIKAFSEAALVGGCADWFAVTALFRRPLGLPIPHTAIIPRNKDRIGEALGRFIVENFLSPRVLDAKLRDFELSAWGSGWLSQPQNARALAGRIVAWTPELVRVLPEGAVETLAGSIALAAVKATPAAPTASKLLALLWSEGRSQPIITALAERLGAYLAEHQDVILEQVQAQSWRWMPKFVDRVIAEKITAGLVRLLADIGRPDHPWRVTIAAEVEGWIVRLAEDPELRARGEELKLALLNDPRLADRARELWSDIKRRTAVAWTEGADELELTLTRLLADLGVWLRDDPAVQRTLNTAARALARRVLAPRRHEIGRFIAQVVAGWDTRSVVDRLELQVGPDLQYIRVNGTIVGGLVGLTLSTLGRLLGLA